MSQMAKIGTVIFDQNGWENTPFEAAPTSIAHIRKSTRRQGNRDIC